jgi:hypothetical protein
MLITVATGMSITEVKPILYLHFATKNDTNGNPRRVFVVFEKMAK